MRVNHGWLVMNLTTNSIIVVMKNTKKAILNLVAKTGMSSAVKAAGAASSLGYHQPKEPKTLQNLKK